MTTIKSKAGIEYLESDFDGSWWIKGKMDNPNKFIGAEFNLPNEILRKLSKIRKLSDYTLSLIKLNPEQYKSLKNI
jgi:hypothetical protein